MDALVVRLRGVASGPMAPFETLKETSYLEAHAAFLRFFESRTRIDRDTLILGASLVYSWMPRILTLGRDALDEAADHLERIRSGHEPSAADYEVIKKAVNNSMVGTSKLLHFIAPRRFPILDSRVSRFLGWKSAQIGEVATYQRYRSLCVAVSQLPAFDEVHAKVQERLGQMDRLRAAELLMYLGGAKSPGQ